MSRLAERLARLKDTLKAPKAPNPSRKNSSLPSSLPGWEYRSLGFWERCQKGPAILPLRFASPFLLPKNTKAEDLVFYDLETTGLSGGAGNVAFLIGLGQQRDGFFQVKQFFLADYPGERALLERLRVFMDDSRPQVSFNGLSFDRHVLRTRFLLQNLPPPTAPQIDLLYPSRRMWRPVLPNVSLSTLETQVLNLRRQNDIPGSEIPEVWFRWLRTGDHEKLENVFSHNEEDIRSLARLLVCIEGWAAHGPPNSQNFSLGLPPDYLGMALALRSSKKEEYCLEWLQTGWKAGHRSCGKALALVFKKAGDFEKARKLWEILLEEERDFLVATELAKYWEHKRRNPQRALEVLEKSSTLHLTIPAHRDYHHRRRRLQNKVKLKSS